jgi:hypothetical protein
MQETTPNSGMPSVNKTKIENSLEMHDQKYGSNSLTTTNQKLNTGLRSDSVDQI